MTEDRPLTMPIERLRIQISDGIQVWTPVDEPWPAGLSDDERQELIADKLRFIADSLTDTEEQQ